MKLNTTRYARILLSLLKEAENDEVKRQVTANFFAWLKRHKQLNKAEGIVKKAQMLDDAENGIIRLNIISAHPLPTETLKEATEAAKPLFGAREIIPVLSTDPSLIGGLQLKSDDALFDASVKTALFKLKKQLKTGTEALS